MSRLLRVSSALAAALGFLFLIPGLVGVLLLLVSTQLSSLRVDRDSAAHGATLYPPDLAPDSEPR